MCSLMMCKDNWIYYGQMVVFMCLDFMFGLSLSFSCWCIWRYWSSKMLVRYIMSTVCLRLIKFSQLSYIQCMGMCIFSLPISLMMIVRISVLYIIIIIKLEAWPICHYSWLGHETIVCTVCLSTFMFNCLQTTGTSWLTHEGKIWI